MRPGLSADRASYPRPRLSMYPGLKDSRMKSDLAASFLEQLAPVSGLDVQRDSPLIHAIGPPEEALFGMWVVFVEGASEPGAGAAHGLHLDDIGAHVGQHLAAPVEPALG